MRWESGRRSSNIEDRRGMRGAGVVGGGGIGILLVVLAVSFISGRNPLDVLQEVEQSAPAPAPESGPVSGPPPDDPQGQMVSAVLADTEDTWQRIFSEQGSRYQEPTLVLFDGQVRSACGRASAAVGPFYCPADQKVYLDLSFFRELARRFGAPGDFAQAYVIAHEVGHHVQTLTGVSRQVQEAQARVSERERNQLSVQQELQADCYAGVWAHHAARRDWLEPGDVEEGLRAAEAIGDDNLQKQSQGVVVPESFTHGSSEQRQRWLTRGLETGDVRQCDTFSAATY